jgi:hypothetical protein
MVGKPKQDLESSPISPLLELSLNDEVALDTLPDPALDPVVVRGPIWNVQYHVFMTPEPPELPI